MYCGGDEFRARRREKEASSSSAIDCRAAENIFGNGAVLKWSSSMSAVPRVVRRGVLLVDGPSLKYVESWYYTICKKRTQELTIYSVLGRRRSKQIASLMTIENHAKYYTSGYGSVASARSPPLIVTRVEEVSIAQ
jgi:hypothetical protein